MLVTDINYTQAMRAIREIVLDTGLVQCFRVSGQDLLFKKTPTDVTLGTVTKLIGETEALYKVYDLASMLNEQKVVMTVLPDYVANEFVNWISDFEIENINDPAEGHIITAKNYFSDSTIETVMVEFFSKFVYYDGIEKTTQEIFDMLDYFTKRKMVFWVSFYLIDRRRMQMASTSVLISQADGGSSCGGGDFKNTDVDVTTRVGDVYTEMTKTTESGKGLDGFTSLWGDRYSYLTKLQLWIRERYEKLFGDYSLRDDCMISQTFVVDKFWEKDAWVDTMKLFSNDTYGILVEDRDLR